MKILIFALFVSLNAHATLEEKCSAPLGKTSLSPVEDCLDGTIAVIAAMKSEESDTPEAARAAATLFLEQYKDKVNFETEPAKVLAARLVKHANNTALSNAVRSDIWLQAAGVYGRLSDKLRANGGLEQGKFALAATKTSLSFNKMNEKAVTAYASTIIAFTEQNFISKKFIESNMEIKISDEVKSAMKVMEVAKMTSDPLYAKLKKY